MIKNAFIMAHRQHNIFQHVWIGQGCRFSKCKDYNMYPLQFLKQFGIKGIFLSECCYLFLYLSIRMCLIKRRCNMKEKVCVISQLDKNLMYTAVHFTDSQVWAVYEFQVFLLLHTKINSQLWNKLFPGRLESGLKHTEILFNPI